MDHPTPKLQHPTPPGMIEVSAGLIFRQGQLLITRRRTGDHLGGLWEFPGGKREPNESFEDCLVRELREELGVETRPGELLEDITHHYPDKSVRLRFYRCELVRGEPRPIGCDAVQWVAASQLSSFSFPAADARLLVRLESDSRLWSDRLSGGRCGGMVPRPGLEPGTN